MSKRKLVALSVAALMLLATVLVMAAPAVSAAGMTVELKRPLDGADWIMGRDYRVSWTYLSGGNAQISDVYVEMGVSLFQWSASSDGGPAPTFCILHVTEDKIFLLGDVEPVSISVYYTGPDGTFDVAYDSVLVNIIDATPPDLWFPSGKSQQVVLGAAMTITAEYEDATGVFWQNEYLLVDGQPVPAEKISMNMWHIGHVIVSLNTDWLTLGKHRVTLTVPDLDGNVAKATMTLNVVAA